MGALRNIGLWRLGTQQRKTPPPPLPPPHHHHHPFLLKNCSPLSLVSVSLELLKFIIFPVWACQSHIQPPILGTKP